MINFIFTWIITLVTLLSMRYIQKCSKPLEQQGVYANRYLIGWYSALLLATVLTFTAILVIHVVIWLSDWDKDSGMVTKLRIISLSLSLVMNTTFLALDFVILMLYLKFSDRTHDIAIERMA